MRKMLMICLVAVYCFANQEEYFLQGNKHYQEGNFEQALTAYQKIDKKGAPVLFNMGNCFYHVGNYCSAIVYWLLADSIGPWNIHKKIDYNSALAYKKLAREYPSDTLHSFVRWFMRAMNTISIFWWQLVFLVVWVFSIVLLVQTAAQRRLWRMSAVIVLVCSIMICFVIRYNGATCSYALIIEKEVPIRTGPADNFGVIGTAQCLDKFNIDEQRDNWFKVHNKFIEGWVCAGCVSVIDTRRLNGEQKSCL